MLVPCITAISDVSSIMMLVMVNGCYVACRVSTLGVDGLLCPDGPVRACDLEAADQGGPASMLMHVDVPPKPALS